MSCMKTVSVRELQQNIKRVIDQVEHGEVVEVTRRRRVGARLTPVSPSARRVWWPDLEARAQGVFGDGVIAPPASQQVSDNRGRW